LFERQDKWLCFVNDGNVVIFAEEDVEPYFLLDFSYLPAESRWVNVKSFRRFTEVQLTRNSEDILELSEWGSTSHEFTTRMKSSESNRRFEFPALTKGIFKGLLWGQTSAYSLRIHRTGQWQISRRAAEFAL